MTQFLITEVAPERYKLVVLFNGSVGNSIMPLKWDQVLGELDRHKQLAEDNK